MDAVWAPQEEATAKICGLFSEYQHPGSNQSQVGAAQLLCPCQVSPSPCCAADCTSTHPMHSRTCTRRCRQSLMFTSHLQVLAQLERCRAFPDFNNYLALILAQGNHLQLEVGHSVQA